MSSCYDDSELWAGLEDLEQRVTALEDKLNSEVATLNGLISTLDGKVKDLTAADESLLAKLTALNTQVGTLSEEAKATAEAVNKLTSELDALDGIVDGVVADLEQALKDMDAADGALDGKLNALSGELKGLSTDFAAAVAKIAVVKAEKNKAGNYVLTFADGSTLEVAAADPNANNTGLVTIVDGKWAIVGADGKTTVLDAEVDPDTELEFKVSETYEVLVSYDGKNWEPTGVFVKDSQTLNVVTGFKDGKDYVTITVGGVEYNLPKVSNNSFEIRSGKVFFQAEQKKVVSIKKEGVVSMMLAKKPADWTVDFLDESLEITAPSEDEMTYDNKNGVVEVWVVTEDGKTLVGRLSVEVGEAPAVMTVDNKFETLSVELDSAYDLFYGVSTVEDFDAAAILAKLPEAAYNPVDGIFYNIDYTTGNPIVEKDHKFAEMLGANPEVGETYIVWSIAADMEWADPYLGTETTCSSTEVDFVKKYVTVVGVDIAKPVTSWNNAELNVTVKGTDKFYIGLYPGPQSMLTDPEGGILSDEMIEYLEAKNESSLAEIFEMGLEGVQGAVHKGSYVGNMTDIDDNMWLEVAPTDEYTLIVLPIIDGKTSYSASDLYYEEFEIDELVYGGSATVTLGEGDPKAATDITFNSFTLPIEHNGARVYYSIWYKSDFEESVTEFEEDGDDETDMLTFLMDNIYLSEFTDWSRPIEITESVAIGHKLQMTTEYMVAAFAVDESGACSELVTLPVTTKGLPYTATPDTHKVTVTSVSAIDGSATATFTIAGEGAEVLYFYKGVNNPEGSTVYTEDQYDDLVMSALAEGDYYPEEVDLNSRNFIDGVATVTDIYMGNEYDTYIYAFVKYEDGTVSKITKSAAFNNINTPNLKQWMTASSENALAMTAAGQPVDLVFDFGVSIQNHMYSSLEEREDNTMMIGMDGSVYGPDYEGEWLLFMQMYGYYTITPTNATSGIIEYTNMYGGVAELPYSDFDGEGLTLDIAQIFMSEDPMELELVLVEEEVLVQMQ